MKMNKTIKRVSLPTSTGLGITVRRVILTFLFILLTTVTALAQDRTVVGCLEVCKRVSVDSVYVKGWAYFPENPEDSVDIFVAGYERPECTISDEYTEEFFWANLPRPDVNELYGITGNHGFEGTIVYRSNCYVEVMAIVFYETTSNKYFTLADVVNIIDYYLEVGGVCVTTENLDNILDELDADGNPTATYNPDTKTLTLNESAKLSSYDGCLIESGRDLNIKGRFHMSSSNFRNTCAIEVSTPYSLTLDGDFLFFAKELGIGVQNEVILNSGRLAIGCEDGHAIYGCSTLIIKDTFEKLEIKRNVPPVISIENLTLPDNLSIITPVGGFFSEKTTDFMEADSTTDCSYVVIATQAAAAEPNTFLPDYFPLWVGDTRVSTLNMNDICGDGGKAQFNPSTCTLTLNNPTITGSYKNSRIYVAPGLNLTITGIYNQTEADAWFGIGLDEDAHYTSSGEYVDANPSLTLSGEFTFRGSVRGINGERNNITVQSGTLTAIGNNYGINCRNLTLQDNVDYVELESFRSKALNCSSLTISDNLMVVVPTDYEFNNGFFNRNIVIQDKNMTAPVALKYSWYWDLSLGENGFAYHFTWDPPTTTYSILGYAYSYKKRNDMDWSDEVVVNTTSVFLKELPYYEGFDFRVRAIYSKPGKAYAFISRIGTVSLPYEFGFEDGMGGWTIVDGDNQPSEIINRYHHGGEFCCLLWCGDKPIEKPMYLISPLFFEGVFMKMSFYVEGSGTFLVGFSSTTNDPDAFEWEKTYMINADDWVNWTLYCPAHTRFVAIKWIDGTSLLFDDFAFEEFTPPSVPDSLAATDVTATCANITWTGDAPMYYVIYKTVSKFYEDNANGYGNYNWTIEKAEENHLNLVGLQPLTEYVFQVISYQPCYLSDWSSLATFTTTDYTILANDDDNQATITSCYLGKHDVILHDRTFYRDGDWNTLCLPFNVTDGDDGDGISFSRTPLQGATVMELDVEGAYDNHRTGMEDMTLYLNFKDADSIVAGKPYIVRWTDVSSFTINSDIDWATFAQRVKDGETFAGKNVLLGADINVTAMVGTADKPFCGTFDGAGHTLNVNINQADVEYAAPFRYISDATICNVKTTGVVHGGLHSAGLVGAATGVTNSIRDCWMDATVTTSQSYIGGILGSGTTSATTISNCYLTGRLIASYVGIFYGWGEDAGTHSIADCWAMGEYSAGNGINMLMTNGGTTNVTNCFRNTEDSRITQGSFSLVLLSNSTVTDVLGSQWALKDGHVTLSPTEGVLSPELHNPVFNNVTISNSTPTAVTSEDGTVTFVGNYDPFVIDESNIDEVIYLGSNNIIGYASAPRTLRAFRAHFDVPTGGVSHAPIRQVLINYGTTTAVIPIASDVNDASAADDAWYTIHGIRLEGEPTEKGLYIHNGEKYSIK